MKIGGNESMKRQLKGTALILSIGALLGLAACGSNGTESTAAATTQADPSAAQAAEPVVIKLGVVGENNEQWKPVQESLAVEGITLELVKFADYSLPNQALADGEIDLNAFQHYAFFHNEVADKGLELTVIGETIIAPLGLYSENVSSIGEIGQDASIAIPSDATNGGRAIKLLEAAGLIQVDPAAGYTPTLSDITDNSLHLTFYEVEAANTASLLPDVTASVINGGHAVDNGLSPEKDALFIETVSEGSDNPYINIIAARTADAEKPNYKKVVEAFQTDEVAKVIEEYYKGAYIPVW